MKKNKERKLPKPHGHGKIDLTEEELNSIKTISEY